MTNRFLVSVAALALIAGTGMANAQGGRESGGASMQSTPSSAGGGAAGGATTEHHEGGMGAGSSSGMKAEQKSPVAGQNQRAEEHGRESKSMSSENETKGAANNMKAEGREERNANKSAESSEGRKTEKNAENREGRETGKSAESREGRDNNMKAEGREGRETGKNAENREGRDNNMKAEGREGHGNMNAETRTGNEHVTTGQAGAAAKLSTEQRTRITTIIRDEHVAPVNNVDFAISVGTRVPRERIDLRPLPTEVINVYPEWRGYEFFLVRDEIVVVDPRTLEIVAVLEA